MKGKDYTKFPFGNHKTNFIFEYIKSLKPLFGILLILSAFAFLVWKFMSLDLSFGLSLILNVLAFLVFGIGLLLMGVDMNSKKNKTSAQKPAEEIKKTPEEVPLKDFKKDDHDRFMPK